MTEPNGQRPAVADDLTFTTKASEAPKLLPFVLDGEQLTAVRPKEAAMLSLAALDETDPVKIEGAMTSLLNGMFTPETAARLRARLDDPDDECDLSTLEPVIETLLLRFYPEDSAAPVPARLRARHARATA